MLPKSLFTFLLFFSLSFAENITINNISSYSISSIHSIKTYTKEEHVFEYNVSTKSNEYVRTDTLTVSKPLIVIDGYASKIAEYTQTKNECLSAIKSSYWNVFPVSIIITDDFYIIKYSHSSKYFPKKDFVISFATFNQKPQPDEFCPDSTWK